MPRLLVLLLLWGMAQAEPVKLVAGTDYAPFTDPALPGGGQAVVLVKKVLDKAGLPWQLDWRPWANGYRATLNGAYMATFPYISTPERRKLFAYSDPLFTLELRVFALPGSKLDGAHPESLVGKRYCQPVGWGFLNKIEKMVNKGQIQLIRPYDISSCIRLIAEDKADFIITDQIQGNATIAQLSKLSRLPVASGGILEETPLYLIVGKENPQGRDFLNQFNRALKEIRKTQ